MGWIPLLDPELRLADRLLALAELALKEALAHLAAGAHPVPNLSVALACPELRPGVDGAVVEWLSDRIRSMIAAVHPVKDLEVFTAGHAGGLMAVQACVKKFASEPHSFCLVGGVDSYMDPDTVDWLSSEELLKTDSNPHGILPGEAASFALLSGAPSIAGEWKGTRGLKLSVSVAEEPITRKSGGICLGADLTAVARSVITQMDCPERSISAIYSDLNGQPYRADEFGFLVSRISPWLCADWKFETPADSLGDVGAASGILSLVLACFSGPGAFQALLLTGSDDRDRAAALVSTG